MIKFRKPNPITTALKAVLLSNELEHTIIQEITAYDYTLSVVLRLPPKKEIADLLLLLPNLQQELNASDVKFGTQHGKLIEILFGMRNLDDHIPFNPSFLHPNTLKIELPSSYGSSYLDFLDGASHHLLNGGATRMGKTSLWLYLLTCLYLQNKDNIQFLICSTKPEDFHPFKGIPGFQLADEHHEVSNILENFIQIKNQRKSILQSLGDVKDTKGIQKRYPQLYPHFHPLFLVMDEYGSYSDNPIIQQQVIELVERGGSYNIHCIIACQRPDARTVLPARIKANLLARICFTTADSNNSIIILDKDGAENLGGIPGRCIFQNGFQTICQIPLLEDDECRKILNPYRLVPRETIKGSVPNEPNQSETGPNDSQLANQIQNMFQESNSLHPFSK